MTEKAKSEWRWGALLFLVTLVVYGLTTYGGIRSPDSEVVFRTCEALATGGSLGIEPLEQDPGFGMAPGRNGQLYSVFGPLESLVCAAFYPVSRIPGLAPASVPPSHYAQDGIEMMFDRESTSAPAHRTRFVVSFLTVLISAVSVWIFFLMAGRIFGSPPIALLLASLFAFGTLAWPYSSTFFSEPLSVVMLLLAFLLLVRGEAMDSSSVGTMLGAGLFAGLGATAHLSSTLFLPFLLVYAVAGRPRSNGTETAIRRGVQFAIGCTIPLVLLGLYNLYRFGSPLETGRGVVPDAVARFGYGSWVSPWEGLVGLLVSPGKGLLWFCPLTILGLIAFPALLRSRRVLGWTLLGAVVVRALIIAARSDWHGGFGLGPRYLLPAIPLLILPLGAWLEERPSKLRWGVALSAGVLALVQQFYFVLGEIFSYYHGIWKYTEHEGRLELLQDVYFNWEFSPLLFLLRGQRGPWTLQGAGVADSTLLVLFGVIVTVGAMALYRWAIPKSEG